MLVCGVYVCACINMHIDTQDNLNRYGSSRNTKEKHVMNRMTAKHSLMFCMWVDN